MKRGTEITERMIETERGGRIVGPSEAAIAGTEPMSDPTGLRPVEQTTKRARMTIRPEMTAMGMTTRTTRAESRE
jgi:hypothetical protein